LRPASSTDDQWPLKLLRDSGRHRRFGPDAADMISAGPGAVQLGQDPA
jgi:hypothetical protein